MTFEIGDEETLVARGLAVGERLSGRSQTHHERTFTVFGFSDIEIIARVRAVENNPPAVGARLQRVPRPGPSVFLFGETREFGRERGNYYPSLSAKFLLKMFFRQNTPKQLGSSQFTSLNAVRMVQFNGGVALEDALAPYGMLDYLLLKADVCQTAASWLHQAGNSP